MWLVSSIMRAGAVSCTYQNLGCSLIFPPLLEASLSPRKIPWIAANKERNDEWASRTRGTLLVGEYSEDEDFRAREKNCSSRAPNVRSSSLPPEEEVAHHFEEPALSSNVVRSASEQNSWSLDGRLFSADTLTRITRHCEQTSSGAAEQSAHTLSRTEPYVSFVCSPARLSAASSGAVFPGGQATRAWDVRGSMEIPTGPRSR